MVLRFTLSFVNPRQLQDNGLESPMNLIETKSVHFCLECIFSYGQMVLAIGAYAPTSAL